MLVLGIASLTQATHCRSSLVTVDNLELGPVPTTFSPRLLTPLAGRLALVALVEWLE